MMSADDFAKRLVGAVISTYPQADALDMAVDMVQERDAEHKARVRAAIVGCLDVIDRHGDAEGSVFAVAIVLAIASQLQIGVTREQP